MLQRKKTKYRSRLAKVESKKFQQQTFLITGLTLLIIALILIFGIPIMIRLAIFFGDLRSGTSFTNEGDQIPPYVPQIVSLPIATNSARLTISGFSEAGSTVTLLRSGKRVDETIADSESKFNFEDITLSDGDNSYTIFATDEDGNESKESEAQVISYDTEAPEIIELSPEEGRQFFGREERLATISGVTEVGARVTVNGKHAVVNKDGEFETTFQLDEGESVFLIEVVDRAGNSANKELKVSYRP